MEGVRARKLIWDMLLRCRLPCILFLHLIVKDNCVMLRKPYCTNLMFTSTNDNILYYTIVSFTFLVNLSAIIQISMA